MKNNLLQSEAENTVYSLFFDYHIVVILLFSS